MDQTTQNIPSMHVRPSIGFDERRPRCLRRWDSQFQRAMGPGLVGVSDVDPEDSLEVADTEDQQPVHAIPPCGPYPSFRLGVCVRGLPRSLDDLRPVRAECVIKAGDEHGVPIADQEAARSAEFGESNRDVARLE
jgi:hypothetical protein